MAFPPLSEQAKGRIAQVDIDGLPVGGQTALPFHLFEGSIPLPPRLAFEIWDQAPTDWPEPLAEVFGDVWGDAPAWARRVAGYGADLLLVRLVGSDPHGLSRSAEESARVAAEIVRGSGLPCIVLGPGDPEVDAEVAKAVAAELSGHRSFLGMAVESNHRSIGAAALGYGHGVVASSPIDVNLAKQLNVLLGRLGLDEESIIMDPTTGALGYGLEYSYTVFERIRLAALAQNDLKMQAPILALVGEESWKTKESRATEAELAGAGDLVTRGLLWEAITGLVLALAGADILVVRHPRSAQLLRACFSSLLGA